MTKQECENCRKWEEDFNEINDNFEKDLENAKKEIERYYLDKNKELKELLKSANKYIEKLKLKKEKNWNEKTKSYNIR
ncbi:MAG: hypothetical protein ACTSPI_01375 [Candidatus Heimdallarchaeaceae archaeon]